MNNTQLAIKIKSFTCQGSYEDQLEAIEKLLNEHRPEQLFKHNVSGSLPTTIYKDLRTHVLSIEKNMREQNYYQVIMLLTPLIQKLENYHGNDR